MLKQLAVILQKKYPQLEIQHYIHDYFITICDQNHWIMTIHDDYITYRALIWVGTYSNPTKHSATTNITPTSPNYFQEIDKAISNYQRFCK